MWRRSDFAPHHQRTVANVWRHVLLSQLEGGKDVTGILWVEAKDLLMHRATLYNKGLSNQSQMSIVLRNPRLEHGI